MMRTLFETPLWEFEIPGYQELNKRLMAVLGTVEGGHRYFETDNDAVREFKNIVEDYMSAIAKERGWRDLVLKGRQNVIMPRACDTPHNHPVSALTGVYYLEFPENSGDILLHDPRGGIDYSRWSYSERRRPFVRITPKVGTILIFPGYLVHSVEANLSRVPRISIVVDAE